MTKKDFVMVARVLNEQWQVGNDAERAVVGALARRFERELRADNGRFDADKFHRAVVKE